MNPATTILLGTPAASHFAADLTMFVLKNTISGLFSSVQYFCANKNCVTSLEIKDYLEENDLLFKLSYVDMKINDLIRKGIVMPNNNNPVLLADKPLEDIQLLPMKSHDSSPESSKTELLLYEEHSEEPADFSHHPQKNQNTDHPVEYINENPEINTNNTVIYLMQDICRKILIELQIIQSQLKYHKTKWFNSWRNSGISLDRLKKLCKVLDQRMKLFIHL